MPAATGGLAGYAVLVTGGGSGIGRACAARLAADGAAVTICGRGEERLEEAAARIAPLARESGHGGSIHWTAADVTQEDSVRAAVARALEPTGRLNGCIANAGGGGAPAPHHLQQTQEYLRVLHLNVLGTLLCVKHTAPLLAATGGAFVGMSSIAGHLTHRWFGAYGAAKAGIEQMMRNCADEYGPRGVRFNAIAPGFIATEMMQAIPLDGETYASYLRNTPLGDVGQPEDVAALARFLIGPEARWITGVCVDVDGGHHLRQGPDFSAFLPPGANSANSANGAAGAEGAA